MTLKAFSNPDGSGEIQVGGSTRIRFNTDGTIQGLVSPSLADDTRKIATTELLRDLAFGIDQSWQQVMAQRAINVTYTNTTGKPILVFVVISSTASTIGLFQVDGAEVMRQSQPTIGAACFIFGVVPPGSTYAVGNSAGAGSIFRWAELR